MAESADNSNQLSLVHQQVLVQTAVGIFYGVLEKSDTRIGTALLSNAYMLTPGKHITYLQYLDTVTLITDKLISKLAENEMGDSKPDDAVAKIRKQSELRQKIRKNIGPYFDKEKSIPISTYQFKELSLAPNIIEFATEGVAMVFNEASSWSEYDGARMRDNFDDEDNNPPENQSHVNLLSLTGVQAVVPVMVDNELVSISPFDFSEEIVSIGATFSHLGPNSMLQINTPKLVLSDENERQ